MQGWGCFPVKWIGSFKLDFFWFVGTGLYDIWLAVRMEDDSSENTLSFLGLGQNPKCTYFHIRLSTQGLGRNDGSSTP